MATSPATPIARSAAPQPATGRAFAFAYAYRTWRFSQALGRLS